MKNKHEKARRAVIYVRVAAIEQGTEKALERQEYLCRGYCQKNGIEVVGVYRDAGASGRDRNRKGLRDAINYCRDRKNKVHEFIVESVDRLTRNIADYYDFKDLFTSVRVNIKALA